MGGGRGIEGLRRDGGRRARERSGGTGERRGPGGAAATRCGSRTLWPPDDRSWSSSGLGSLPAGGPVRLAHRGTAGSSAEARIRSPEVRPAVGRVDWRTGAPSDTPRTPRPAVRRCVSRTGPTARRVGMALAPTVGLPAARPGVRHARVRTAGSASRQVSSGDPCARTGSLIADDCATGGSGARLTSGPSVTGRMWWRTTPTPAGLGGSARIERPPVMVWVRGHALTGGGGLVRLVWWGTATHRARRRTGAGRAGHEARSAGRRRAAGAADCGARRARGGSGVAAGEDRGGGRR